MIPQNIKKNHIIQAIKDINTNGIPPLRGSRDYDLIFEKKRYPPKYVLSLANKFANGKELVPSDLHSVNDTHPVLKKLGFIIIKKSSSNMKNISNINLIRYKNQIIFYGPPGTGKTYNAREIAVDLIGGEKSNA